MLEVIHRIVWGPWLMVFFLAAGVYYTVRSRGFQLGGFVVWWSATVGSFFGGGREKDGAGARNPAVSRRQQLRTACTALAATVGTGNIVGVATAITAGGPGALFWMWVSAAIGMMTAYGEVYLGIASRYRGKGGSFVCGPFVYLERLAGRKGLALLYAGLSIGCSLGMGSMVQANSLAETACYSFHIPKLCAAAGLGILVAMIIRGGRQQIGQAAARLVPVSAGIYMVFSVAVLVLCRNSLAAVFGEIFREAFGLRAAAGGAAGYGLRLAVRYGLARGVFSNEAGLGSMAVLHGDSPGQDPKLQGMWAMFEVFFDTIVVCTLTGLVILCGLWEMGGDPGISGAALTSWCFSNYLGKIGEYVIALSLVLFAFATIIAWYYLGGQAIAYLAERKQKGGSRQGSAGKRDSGLLRLYPYVYLAAVCWGCVASMDHVWLLSDILNGLMALPNLTALFLLADQVAFPEIKRNCYQKINRKKSEG